MNDQYIGINLRSTGPVETHPLRSPSAGSLWERQVETIRLRKCQVENVSSSIENPSYSSLSMKRTSKCPHAKKKLDTNVGNFDKEN